MCILTGSFGSVKLGILPQYLVGTVRMDAGLRKVIFKSIVQQLFALKKVPIIYLGGDNLC